MIIIRRLLLALGGVAAVLVAAAGWLGYFGGPLYVPVAVPASMAAPSAALAPAAGHRVAAVIISGDMGFKIGMGPQIGDRLAAHGIPVLGVNSLAFFRERRTPAQIRAFVAEAIRRGLAFGHADRLVLIGQSFGADMVHVGLVDLPADLRAKLAMVALIVPGDTVDYQASPLELANLVTPDAPAYPTASALTWVPTLCVRGADETDSLCPLLHAPNVDKIILPGGHPLHRDADRLFATLAGAINTYVAPAPIAVGAPAQGGGG